MFTVHSLATNGTLGNKEHLNNDELDEWMHQSYGKFATVQVVQDLTGKKIIFADNGQEWERV